MNTTLKTILAFIIVVAAVIGVDVLMKNQPVAQAPELTNTPQATTLGNEFITITSLSARDSVMLPTTIAGTVVGNWFFEGSFPVFIKDTNGATIATGLASSTSDWMTTNHIPFSVTLPTVNYHGPATIVFQKDNPNDDPNLDANFTIAVTLQ